MTGRRMIFVAVGASILVVVLVFVMYFWDGSSDHEITLPSPAVSDSANDDNSMSQVEIQPDNVQAVIATLEQRDNYTRTMQVESFWGDGESAVYTVSVWAYEGLMRMQITGAVEKDMILTGDSVYIWYDGAAPVYQGTLEESTAQIDAFQMIPSYEDVLELDASSIQAAGYVEYEGQYCICVQALTAVLDYVETYYISTTTGLLVGAETYEGETLIYRMSETNFAEYAGQEGQFTLPDGQVIRP